MEDYWTNPDYLKVILAIIRLENEISPDRSKKVPRSYLRDITLIAYHLDPAKYFKLGKRPYIDLTKTGEYTRVRRIIQSLEDKKLVKKVKSSKMIYKLNSGTSNTHHFVIEKENFCRLILQIVEELARSLTGTRTESEGYAYPDKTHTSRINQLIYRYFFIKANMSPWLYSVDKPNVTTEIWLYGSLFSECFQFVRDLNTIKQNSTIEETKLEIMPSDPNKNPAKTELERSLIHQIFFRVMESSPFADSKEKTLNWIKNRDMEIYNLLIFLLLINDIYEDQMTNFDSNLKDKLLLFLALSIGPLIKKESPYPDDSLLGDAGLEIMSREELNKIEKDEEREFGL